MTEQEQQLFDNKRTQLQTEIEQVTISPSPQQHTIPAMHRRRPGAGVSDPAVHLAS